MKSLANERSIVINQASKGSVVVAWDRNDYFKETQKQLGDEKNYRKKNFIEEKSIKENNCLNQQIRAILFFKELNSKGNISGKTLKHFTYEYKKIY